MQDPAEQQAGTLAHAFATGGAWASEPASARAASENITPPFTGAPLPDDTRRRFEGFFGVNLSAVRLFADRESAAAAQRLHTSAFTVGQAIHFADNAYREHTLPGSRLLAHELAHTVQAQREPVGTSATVRLSPDPPPNGATAAPAPTPQAPGVAPSTSSGPAENQQRVTAGVGPHDERLNQEFESWNRAAVQFDEAGDHHDAAYALRITLMLQGVPGDKFADDAALEAFLEGVQRDALDEIATLRITGEWALNDTKAFPLIWSGRVLDALHLDFDAAAMEQQRLQSQQAMLTTADSVPAFVADSGLPVPYAEALSLSDFVLQLRHTQLPRAHVVKDMALATLRYAMDGWGAGFYAVWNGMAQTYAERVADGEIVVNLKDYTEFVATKQAGLQALGDRIRAIEEEDGLTVFDSDVATLTHATFVAAFASTLLGLVPALMLWQEGSTLFAEKLALVDVAIAAEPAESKVLRAMQWAWEESYFSAAGAELLRNILSHGWEIVGAAVGFIIIQYIPGLNVLVDWAVLAYSGQDAARALYGLYQAFAVVAAAPTAVALQRASAHMAAAMEGDGLRVLLDLLAIGAAAKGIRARADALRRAGLSEQEALRQAMSEATGEEAAALRSAAARQRITARFDPHGVLNGVLDQGVSAEVVEQALMSGMTPQRLNSIVAGLTDAGRAEALIRYAGNYSSPVTRLLAAGLPVSRVGDLLDLGLGLRELRACELVLQRTGRAAVADGLIGTLAEFGPDGVARLVQLTPEGMASVYLAGGGAALRTVLETIALQEAGRLAGFGDWVQFTIVRLNKQGRDLANAIGELREAQRLAETVSAGQRVRIGGDLNAQAASFDIVVEDAAGTAARHVEVTTATGRLESFRDLSDGVRHGIAKARAGAAGSREVTIRVTVTPRVSLGGGRFREISPEGMYRVVEANGTSYTQGDILADAARNLPSITDSGLLNRVNVVNTDGALLGTIENRGGTWIVVR